MRVTNCCFVALISCYHRAVHGYIHQTSSRPHFPRFSLDCNTAAEKFPAEEENPPSVAAVELTPFNDEIRAVLGRTPDKLAQNMYAIGAVQGSSVFKLVGELENLSEALEKTVAGDSDTLALHFIHTPSPTLLTPFHTRFLTNLYSSIHKIWPLLPRN